MTGSAAPVLTDRLELRAPTADDVPALADAVYGDPRTWALDPTLRRSPEELAVFVGRLQERWARDGVGAWVARLRGGDGTPVGIGGCDRLAEGRSWNLFFRLAPAAQGRGLAQELARAGLAAAAAARPDLPVTAVAAAQNTPSLRAIARLGLTEVWRGPDRRSPRPDAVVVLHADRPLAADHLAELTA